MGPVGNTDLDDVGLPGFRLAGRIVPDDLLTSIFGGPVGEVIRSLPWPFIEVIFSYGTLGVHCNGYLASPDALDGLAGAASSIAAGLTDVCAPYRKPRPIETVLAPALGKPPDWAPWFPQPSPPWAKTFKVAAEKYDLTLEEPTDFHSAFPHFPIPGVVQGILRGVLPGAEVDGRMVFNAQGSATEGSMRAGVVIAAPLGARPTPIGGIHVDGTRLYVELVDDIAACWDLHRAVEGFDAGEFCVGALDAIRSTVG